MYAITLDGGIATVIFNIYLLRLGYDAGFIGLIGAVGQGVFAAACIPVGRLGERWGWLTMMRAGVALSLVATLLMPLAGWLDPAWRTPLLMVSAVLNNIGLACYFVTAAPYFSLLCTPEQRTNVFSLQAAAYAAFGMIGGLLGGYVPVWLAGAGVGTLNEPAPYLWTLWLVPLVMLGPLWLSLRMRQASTAQADAGEELLPSGGAPIVAGAMGLIAFFGLLRFLQVGGIAVMQTFFNVYMDQQLRADSATIGWIQAAAKLTGIPMALAVPWLTRRFGPVRTCIMAMLVAGLSILPVGWVPGIAVPALGYWAMFTATPVRYASFMVYAMSRVPARLHGTLNGSQEALAGVGFALMALIGGELIGRVGFGPTFTMGAVLVLVGAVLLAIYAFRKSRP